MSGVCRYYHEEDNNDEEWRPALVSIPEQQQQQQQPPAPQKQTQQQEQQPVAAAAAAAGKDASVGGVGEGGFAVRFLMDAKWPDVETKTLPGTDVLFAHQVCTCPQFDTHTHTQSGLTVTLSLSRACVWFVRLVQEPNILSARRQAVFEHPLTSDFPQVISDMWEKGSTTAQIMDELNKRVRNRKTHTYTGEWAARTRCCVSVCGV